MRRRATALILAFILTSASAAHAARPNIVFIYTDDQAAWALGASQHPHASTPHLDRLVREGAYLVNSFTVTPVCSPSRASLMTSRYGSEVGITEWINPRKEAKHGLDPDTVTWPELLQQHGYTTGLVGKWHLGLPDKFHPTRTGFDYFMGFRGGGNSPQNPQLEKEGKQQKFQGLTPDILTDHAVEFIQRNRQGPFLLCLHYRAPHARWLPVAEQDWAPFAELDPQIPNPDFPKLNVARVKKMTREYLASVKSVDRNVGRVLAELDTLKLTSNTVVIFTSDHGYNMGHNGIWHKGNGHYVLTEPPPATKHIPRGQRPNMYDHSLRVPTIIRWPQANIAGTTVTNTVSNLDWFPTVLSMAGAEHLIPKTIRGRNMTPLLRGKQITWDNDLYGEYSTHHQSTTHMRMLRTPRWKLIRDFLSPERDELYNLQEDPAESNNLIRAATPEIKSVLARLQKKLVAQMQANEDAVLQMPSASPQD
ncbi:MAG TPA: N-acetylgalactosamine 6-sulfate sulfatase [Planctomycetaceae bacterium]|nr:N-acetylgalactosamine 6-sulfate sulfatase [Planctomycetaceae bacterium]